MSAPGLLLARQMRPHLGTKLWDEFVEHVNHCKAGVLRCMGPLDGAPCAGVDLRAGAGTGVGEEREVGKALERLHLVSTTSGRCTRNVTPVARDAA